MSESLGVVPPVRSVPPVRVVDGVMIFGDGEVMQTVAQDKLLAALRAFHAACGPISKSTFNSLHKSWYADLGTILGVVTPALVANDLVLSQAPYGDCMLATTVCHVSGQWIRVVSKFTVLETVLYRQQHEGQTVEVRGTTPQSYGSSITYARRQALASLLSLVIEDDDDGNGASGARGAGDRGGNKPGARLSDGQPSGGGRSQSADAQSRAADPASGAAKKPEAVEPLSQAKITEIVDRIAKSSLEDMPKCEAALTRYGVNGAITKSLWGELLEVLFGRWIDAMDLASVESVRAKLLSYAAREFFTTETANRLLACIDGRVEALNRGGENVE